MLLVITASLNFLSQTFFNLRNKIYNLLASQLNNTYIVGANSFREWEIPQTTHFVTKFVLIYFSMQFASTLQNRMWLSRNIKEKMSI